MTNDQLVNVQSPPTGHALDFYRGGFEQMKEVATLLSKSDLVPDHFKQRPANIIIALEFAHRANVSPFAAMQSMFVISGKPGMSAAMAISLARQARVWKHLRYEVAGKGETLAVRAIATLDDGIEISETVTYQQANADGWTKNPKYKSLPELMLKYRAATFLIRTHFPEVLFGMHTIEELQDVSAARGQRVVDPIPVQPLSNKSKEEKIVTVDCGIDQMTRDDGKHEEAPPKQHPSPPVMAPSNIVEKIRGRIQPNSFERDDS